MKFQAQRITCSDSWFVGILLKFCISGATKFAGMRQRDSLAQTFMLCVNVYFSRDANCVFYAATAMCHSFACLECKSHRKCALTSRKSSEFAHVSARQSKWKRTRWTDILAVRRFIPTVCVVRGDKTNFCPVVGKQGLPWQRVSHNWMSVPTAELLTLPAGHVSLMTVSGSWSEQLGVGALRDIEHSCKVNTFHLNEELPVWWMSL